MYRYILDTALKISGALAAASEERLLPSVECWRLPEDFQRTSTGLPEDFQRTSTGLPQDFHRTSTGLPQDFWGILDDFWRAPGSLLKDFWMTSGGLLKDCWRTYGGLMEDLWRTPGGLTKALSPWYIYKCPVIIIVVRYEVNCNLVKFHLIYLTAWLPNFAGPIIDCLCFMLRLKLALAKKRNISLWGNGAITFPTKHTETISNRLLFFGSKSLKSLVWCR